jgi:hypothetical protein
MLGNIIPQNEGLETNLDFGEHQKRDELISPPLAATSPVS